MANPITRILVTGANGFIGSNFLKNLTDKDYEITAITRADGDIRTIDLEKFGEHNQVVHLANRNFIPDSWKNPGDFFSTNIDGTRNVLEYCRKNDSRLIFISAYVYGQPKYLPIDENHPVSGINPYMKSKILTEELIQFYAKQYNLSAVIIRPFNIYGDRQRDSFLIPTIVRQITDSESNFVYVRSLKPKRDFLHLDDFNSALMEIINHSKLEGFFNIGYGKSFSVESIINTFTEILGRNIKYIESKEERPNEVMDVVANISKISSAIGWKPKLSLKDGLTKVLKSSTHEM